MLDRVHVFGKVELDDLHSVLYFGDSTTLSSPIMSLPYILPSNESSSIVEQVDGVEPSRQTDGATVIEVEGPVEDEPQHEEDYYWEPVKAEIPSAFLSRGRGYLPPRYKFENFTSVNGWDRVKVSDQTPISPSIVTSGVESIKVECQIGMYVEISLNSLSDSVGAFSLPEGMQYSLNCISGTPIHSGRYKSYIQTKFNTIVEIEFEISPFQRTL